MDITTVHTASFFLGGTILTCLAIIVIVAAVILINNIIVRFWKPIRLFTYVHIPLPEEPQEPTIQSPAKKTP